MYRKRVEYKLKAWASSTSARQLGEDGGGGGGRGGIEGPAQRAPIGGGGGRVLGGWRAGGLIHDRPARIVRGVVSTNNQ